MENRKTGCCIDRCVMEGKVCLGADRGVWGRHGPWGKLGGDCGQTGELKSGRSVGADKGFEDEQRLWE